MVIGRERGRSPRSRRGTTPASSMPRSSDLPLRDSLRTSMAPSSSHRGLVATARSQQSGSVQSRCPSILSLLKAQSLQVPQVTAKVSPPRATEAASGTAGDRPFHNERHGPRTHDRSHCQRARRHDQRVVRAGPIGVGTHLTVEYLGSYTAPTYPLPQRAAVPSPPTRECPRID